MSGHVVYDFPAQWPFRLALRRRQPPGGLTGSAPPWQLVRQGMSVAEVVLADLERADLEGLSDALARELARP
jgi:hypothetical protein